MLRTRSNISRASGYSNSLENLPKLPQLRTVSQRRFIISCVPKQAQKEECRSTNKKDLDRLFSNTEAESVYYKTDPEMTDLLAEIDEIIRSSFQSMDTSQSTQLKKKHRRGNSQSVQKQRKSPSDSGSSLLNNSQRSKDSRVLLQEASLFPNPVLGNRSRIAKFIQLPKLTGIPRKKLLYLKK